MSTKIRTGIFSFLGILILILDSKTALSGGYAGLQACLLTVVPTLFPFFVLSILLTGSLAGLQLKILSPIGRFCRMPKGSEPLLLLGLLGGYPAGAQSVYQTYQAGQLTKSDAQRLLGFCSNAGPAFLFGIAGAAFESRWIPWALWLVHIISAVLTGSLLPGGGERSIIMRSERSPILTDTIDTAIKILVRVCAWIILFRVVLAFCDRWFLWALPVDWQVIFSAVLELANGCLRLADIESESLRFLICSGILSLGGFSVAMQTLCVTGNLGFGRYLPGKALQCILSVCLSCLILKPKLIPAALILGFILWFFRKKKIYSRNPRGIVV